MERDTMFRLLAVALVIGLVLSAGCLGRRRGGKKPGAPPGPAPTEAPDAPAAPAATAAPVEGPVSDADLDLTGIEELGEVSADDTDLEIPDIPEDDLEMPEMDFGAEESLDVGSLE